MARQSPNGRSVTAAGSRRADEFRLRIGGIVVSLRCPSRRSVRSLEAYFGTGNSPDPPQVRLALRIVPHDDEPDIPESLFSGKRTGRGSFRMAGDLAYGRVDPDSGEGELHVKELLTHGMLTRVFEQLLYQAFYTGAHRAGYEACLVHSSGIIRGGRGFLFSGSSGSGKSTVARLSGGATILNDEICLVTFENGRVELHDTPFNGYFREKSGGTAPLSALFFLTQANEHRLVPLRPAEAAGRLFPQIVPPMGIEEELSPEVRARMLDLAGRISSLIPVYELRFLPDPGFWQQIEREIPAAEEVRHDRH